MHQPSPIAFLLSSFYSLWKNAVVWLHLKLTTGVPPTGPEPAKTHLQGASSLTKLVVHTPVHQINSAYFPVRYLIDLLCACRASQVRFHRLTNPTQPSGATWLGLRNRNDFFRRCAND